MKKKLIGLILLIMSQIINADSNKTVDEILFELNTREEKQFSFQGERVKCVSNILYYKNYNNITYNRETGNPFFCKEVVMTHEDYNMNFLMGIVIFSDKKYNNEVSWVGKITSQEELKTVSKAIYTKDANLSLNIQQ